MLLLSSPTLVIKGARLARAFSSLARPAEMHAMNVLLIYPGFPDTYWSFRYALSFQGKRAAQPPLGLMTVAALLPASWNKRLIDTNVERLRDRDLA